MPLSQVNGKYIDKGVLGALEKHKPLERTMIFIDGGYLRRLFLDAFQEDKINYNIIKRDLIKWYNAYPPNPYRANLIRVYYYDGIADPKDEPEAHKEQREYFDSLLDTFNFSIILGEAVRLTDGKFRQKGVDILLAIDALSMAYLDHYDSGLFLLGDRDFIPLIEQVKNTGKKTYGFFYSENVSKELSLTFDFRLAFNKKIMEEWRKKK
jgi:uncharacterized LabA/DUF88 family protein